MMRLLVAFLTVIVCTNFLSAQLPPHKTLAVMTWADLRETPRPSITLKWDFNKDGKAVSIWKKLKKDEFFPTDPIVQLDSGTVSWTDTDVEVGVSYEYRLLRDMWQVVGTDSITQQPIYLHRWAFGYINSGIKVPPATRRRVLLLVDTTMIIPLSQEIATWEEDLINEGWQVTIRTVQRAEEFDSGAVVRTRKIIRDEIIAGKRDLDAIFLVGRVPVPYSGDINPDGHENHLGAWPADGTYGDDAGYYTDAVVSRVNASRPANENLPGDGKFDQSQFASLVRTPVGRVDFFNMPDFTKSELELLKAYFKKDHDFRTAQFSVLINGIIDDNFQGYQEGFSTSAWRGFSAFGTDTSVSAGDWFGSLAGPATYLFAHGCGGGTDTSAGGIGSTINMATNPVYAIHTQLFGSYFGDYDTKNNFLRSPLASSPRALTCAWVGRPAWYIHHMALGETVGYSTRIAQNNVSNSGGQIGTYVPNVYFNGNQAQVVNFGDRGVHIALMGDPTLRAIMKPVAIVGQLTVTTEYPNKINLSWLRPVGDVDAYQVFRRTNPTSPFVLLTQQPITATSFRDSLENEGTVEYRINACALRSTASGTYYDLGRGTTTTVLTTGISDASYAGGSREAITGMHAGIISVTPNPAVTSATVTLFLDASSNVNMRVLDISGAEMSSTYFDNLSAGKQYLLLDATHYTPGVYTVLLQTASGTFTKQVVVAR
ncbi:MAG: T9SS type A sorting domain-containing protein [Ignavibacteria bacterium]|nr:T9SS type A sorting domain-containing protein [Ignavibacteria bacterium]